MMKIQTQNINTRALVDTGIDISLISGKLVESSSAKIKKQNTSEPYYGKLRVYGYM